MLKQPYNRPNTLVNITKNIVAGQSAPISLQEAKDYMRVDYNVEDALIQSLITGSYQAFENYTARLIQLYDVTLYYDSFGGTIPLPVAPILEITSVEYREYNGSYVDVTSSWETFGGSIQVIHPQEVVDGGRLKVVLRAGGALPEAVKMGCLKWIASNYEDRQDNISGTIVARMPNESKILWKPYRIMIL